MSFKTLETIKESDLFRNFLDFGQEQMEFCHDKATGLRATIAEIGAWRGLVKRQMGKIRRHSVSFSKN